MTVENGKLRFDNKDVHPKVDPNDNEFFLSVTKSTVYLDESKKKMDIRYIESAINPESNEKTKTRFDESLFYTQIEEK